MAAISLLVTASGLQVMGDAGTLTTLTLPTGVTMVPGTRARIAVMNNRIIITSAVSQPIWLAEDLSLYRLQMPTPASACTLASGGAGTYSGTRQARVSFLIKNTNGMVIAEGPLGPISNSFAASSETIAFSNLPTANSAYGINARRVYLTATGGSTFFAAFDIDDNSTTSGVTDQTADAALSLVSADTDLVAAPSDIDLLAVWKNRVWGRSAVDNVVGTSANRTDRWPNSFSIDPKGSDAFGVTGFAPRRDEMLIGRRNVLWKLVGSSEDDFALVNVAQKRGILAPDSCLVIDDIAYFLSDNGVWSYGPEGLKNLTNDSVRPWFTTDTYFNRSLFYKSFAGYAPQRHKYCLFLPNLGSSVFDRWIELDLETGKFFGPHKCDAVVSFNSATIAPDANNQLQLCLGADDGYIYSFQPTSKTDGASTAIDFDIKGKFHEGDEKGSDPDIMRAWLQPSIFTAVESGGTLTITPTTGDLNSSAGTAVTHDLTLDRERLPRLGTGRLCQLRMRENTAGQGVSVYGYELPYINLGRR